MPLNLCIFFIKSLLCTYHHTASQPAGADVVTKRTVLVMKPLRSQYRSQHKPTNDL